MLNANCLCPNALNFKLLAFGSAKRMSSIFQWKFDDGALQRGLIGPRDHLQRSDGGIDSRDKRLLSADRLDQIPRRTTVVVDKIVMEIRPWIYPPRIKIDRFRIGDLNIIFSRNNLEISMILLRNRKITAYSQFTVARIADGENALRPANR